MTGVGEYQNILQLEFLLIASHLLISVVPLFFSPIMLDVILLVQLHNGC